MAAAVYTTDLAELNLNETSTGMVEPTATSPENWTNLNALASAETDFFIQGTACTSATIKVGVGGLMDNNGSGFTIPTDGAVLAWAYFWAPGVLDTDTNGGIRQMIGSSQSAFYWVSHGGSDTWTYGGWLCLAMADPSATTVNTVGSPTATRQYTGWGYKALAVPARGYPFGIDAIRYGRCTLQAVGGDLANGYASFASASAVNDSNTVGAYNRWGLLQFQDGGYKWQGHLLLGTAGTAVDFRDANRAITVLNTRHVTANFNLIEVRHASSRVDWTGVSITALGTKSKGRFLMTDNADVNILNCNFTDMDSFVFQSNAAITGTVFRRCGLVTAGGASFNGCTFDQPSGTIGFLTSALSTLTDCSFSSDGTGHAIDLGTVAASTTMTWDCTDSGYAATNGSTGNETIKVSVSSGQTLTINVSAGKSTPTYYKTGAGSVSVVSGQVTLTLTGIVPGSDVVILQAGTITEIANIDQLAGSSYGYTYTYSAGTYIDVCVYKAGYVPFTVRNYLLGSSNGSLPISQVTDRNYLP